MKYDAKSALLANIIDYAGTFPPAALSLTQALQEASARDQRFTHPWLYSKMTLALEDLKTVNARVLFETASDGREWQFTALASKPSEPVKTADDWERSIDWDLREIRRINERGTDSAKRHWISAYESRLPDLLFESTAAREMAALFGRVFERTERAGLPGLGLTFEIPLTPQWKAGFDLAMRALADARENAASENRALTVKVRTGGKQPPTAEQLSYFLAQVVLHGFRFKATQGLHAAITHHGEFGFVNLFGALTLAQALGTESFTPALIQQCLLDDNPSHFAFEATQFRWNKCSVDLDAIESARRQHAGAFGSCSLAEPDESLGQIFPTR